DPLEAKDHLGAEVAQTPGMHAGSHQVVAIRTQRSPRLKRIGDNHESLNGLLLSLLSDMTEEPSMLRPAGPVLNLRDRLRQLLWRAVPLVGESQLPWMLGRFLVSVSTKVCKLHSEPRLFKQRIGNAAGHLQCDPPLLDVFFHASRAVDRENDAGRASILRTSARTEQHSLGQSLLRAGDL